MKEAFTNDKWMRGLQKINTESQLDQFVFHWTLLQNVTLSDERDSIVWNVSANGRYSARTAYAVQFLGRVKQTDLGRVWKIYAEGKEFETALHLALGCSFSKEVWACFRHTYPMAVRIASSASTIGE